MFFWIWYHITEPVLAMTGFGTLLILRRPNVVGDQRARCARSGKNGEDHFSNLTNSSESDASELSA